MIHPILGHDDDHSPCHPPVWLCLVPINATTAELCGNHDVCLSGTGKSPEHNNKKCNRAGTMTTINPIPIAYSHKGPRMKRSNIILSFVRWHLIYLNVRLGGRDYLEKQAVLSICAWVKAYGARFGWMNIHKSQLFCSAWLKGLQKKNTSSLGFPTTKKHPPWTNPFITIYHHSSPLTLTLTL